MSKIPDYTRVLLALLLVLVAWPAAGVAQEITTDTVLRKATYVRGSMRGAERVASEVVDSLPSGRLRERAVISRGLLRKALTETLQLEALVETLASSDLPGTPVLRDTVCVAVPGGGVVPCPVVVPPPPPDTVTPAPTPAPPAPAPAPPAPGGSTAELPRVYLDSSMPTGIADTIRVAVGGNVQAAITAAAARESAVVLLAPGTYAGKLTLPARSGAGWVVIRSNAPLPPEGTRVTPATASGFATIMAGADWGIQAVSGAKRYRLTGLEITTDPAVERGRPQIEMNTGSEFIFVDRSYVHGHPTQNFQRCIMANANSVAVVDSYVSECHGIGFDSQAIGSWQSDGPVKIVNNFLEGAGENVIFGGSGSGDPGVRITSDIEIRRNHFFKPLSWLGGPWVVKNLFELKNAQRVLFEGNVLENNWTGGQPGFAVQLTVRNQSGTDPQATVSDITFRWNIIRHSAAGINILAHDTGGKESDWAKRIEISDNSFDGIGQDPALGSSGRAIQVLKNTADLRILRNTFDAAHTMMILDAAGAPLVRLRVEDNLVGPTRYGIFGNATGEKLATWSTHTAGGFVFSGNALVGRLASRYPDAAPGREPNAFPASLAAYDGDAGVDAARLAEMTAGVVQP